MTTYCFLDVDLDARCKTTQEAKIAHWNKFVKADENFKLVLSGGSDIDSLVPNNIQSEAQYFFETLQTSQKVEVIRTASNGTNIDLSELVQADRIYIDENKQPVAFKLDKHNPRNNDHIKNRQVKIDKLAQSLSQIASQVGNHNLYILTWLKLSAQYVATHHPDAKFLKTKKWKLNVRNRFAYRLSVQRNWEFLWTVRFDDDLPSEGQLPFCPAPGWEALPDEDIIGEQNSHIGWRDRYGHVWAPSLNTDKDGQKVFDQNGENHWDVQLARGTGNYVNIYKQKGDYPGEINHLGGMKKEACEKLRGNPTKLDEVLKKRGCKVDLSKWKKCKT